MKKILIIFTLLFLLLASSGINTFAEEGNIESEGTGETASFNESANNEEDSDDNTEVGTNPDEESNQSEEDIGEETIPSETTEENDSNELGEEDGDNGWLFLNSNDLSAASGNDETIYSVKIDWSTINGSAVVSDTYHWDASKQEYVISENGHVTNITPTETTITITNQSDAEVNYSITYANEEEYTSSEILSDDSASASGSINSASSVIYKSKLTLTEVPDDQTVSSFQKVGSYTVNIRK